MIHRFETTIGGRVLSIEAGKVAEQANGAVMVRYGDTVILATVTASANPREGVDFFPLTVDIEEKMYAAGKIPGGYIKREGRAPESAILACRLTDRPIRPLFPKGFRNDVQIVVTVLSTDQENEHESLAIIGASAALAISDIPWAGPVGAVHVGYIDDQFVLNPLESEMENSRLDLSIAGTADAVMMVESGARELPEDVMLEAVKFGHVAIAELVRLQEKLVQVAGKPKREVPIKAISDEVRGPIAEFLKPKLEGAVNNANKAAREDAIDVLRAETQQQFAEQFTAAEINGIFDETLKKLVRYQIVHNNYRPDGRQTTEIRPISCEVGLLPRTHGSGLFTRGQTQVLSVVTLGSISDQQIIDGLGTARHKRFMHQYNFPPYSTGETKPMRGPGRREIGHGALVERSLLAILPTQEEFPYTIRIVSEVLSSNGSSSMGSACGSTLALMDAGVPIKAPISGVAMGLVLDQTTGEYTILTDIQGMEDALGDMDFKVIGTAEGITGLQMDIKVKGITYEIMEKALMQARDGRMFIMGKMLQTISRPHTELSQYAPRITTVKINPEKIGTVIGPGGKTIRKIIEVTGAQIDVAEDGTVTIACANKDGSERAVAMVRSLTEEVEIGKIYTGKVTRIINIGAFVEILPGKEGLVHVSQLADYRVGHPEDVVAVGDEIMVMVTEVDGQGRINLSRRAVLSGELPPPRDRGPREFDRGGDRGGFRGGDRDRGPRPSYGGGGGGGGYRDEPRRGPMGGPGGPMGGPGGRPPYGR